MTGGRPSRLFGAVTLAGQVPLDPVRHTPELGDQVDVVPVGEDKNRPQAVCQLVPELVTGVRDLASTVDRHDELGQIPYVTDEPQRVVRIPHVKLIRRR